LSAVNVVRAAAVRDRLLPIVAVGIVSIAAADSIVGMGKHVPKLLVLLLALAGAGDEESLRASLTELQRMGARPAAPRSCSRSRLLSFFWAGFSSLRSSRDPLRPVTSATFFRSRSTRRRQPCSL